MKRQSVPLPAWLPENALKPRIAGTGVNSISARLEVDAVSAVFVPDPEADLFPAQGSISNPRVFARLQIGEGARPRAPRGRALTQGVFSSEIKTRPRLRQQRIARTRSLPGDGAALIPRKERLVSLLVVCLFWGCEKEYVCLEY